jgi:uncharacterized membrane protein YgaE (UPF0421/DUF939 family)
MPSQRFAVVLACFLMSHGAVAQIRRSTARTTGCVCGGLDRPEDVQVSRY